MDASFAVVKRKPEKIQACKGFEPFDLELQYLKESAVVLTYAIIIRFTCTSKLLGLSTL